MHLTVRWLRYLVLGLAAAAGGTAAGEVPDLRDLHQAAAQVKAQGTPLLLLFYMDHCIYCTRVEDEFLKPMLVSGDYDDKVVIRRVRLDERYKLKDFDGRAITGAGLAARYKVSVTPTLLLLGPEGAELAEKMVGLSTPDFFGGYLEEAIETALMRLRGIRHVTAARLQ